MNLQTDNDMKRVLLFFSLMLLLGNIKGLAQSIVIDPVMIGTLVYSHQEQQGVLKDIQSEETKIRNFQILIQQKMNQIQSLQEKTYNYLSTVNAVVKNGKDIIYASTLARDIATYQSEAAKYAVGDPKLLTIIARPKIFSLSMLAGSAILEKSIIQNNLANLRRLKFQGERKFPKSSEDFIKRISADVSETSFAIP